MSYSHLLSHESQEKKTKKKKTENQGVRVKGWAMDWNDWLWRTPTLEGTVLKSRDEPYECIPQTHNSASPIFSDGLLNETKVCAQQFSPMKNAESGKSSVLVAGTWGLIIELGRVSAASMLTNNIAMTYLASKAKIKKSLCKLQHTCYKTVRFLVMY